MGCARLLTLAYEKSDLADLRSDLVERAKADPRDANAWLDLSTIFSIHRLPDLALATQREALAIQSVFRLPATAGTTALRLLAIKATGDLSANMPIEFLVQDSDVQLDILYVGNGIEPPDEIPEHDVAIVAIAECDRHLALLSALQPIVEAWPRPVLNRPERIAALSRTGVAAALADLPGAYVPPVVRVNRTQLAGAARGQDDARCLLPDGALPVIVRPVDSHGGHGLARLDSVDDIGRYLAQHADSEFYVSQYVDYRSPDGRFRKYRAALVDGVAHACHMAASEHWIVHYLSAGMADSAEKRAEEAEFIARFDSDFGRRHAAAFAGIHARLGLEYVVIDCAEGPDGRLLLWEADHCGVVHAMEPMDLFPYKRRQMANVFAAFRDLLMHTAHGR